MELIATCFRFSAARVVGASGTVSTVDPLVVA